MTLIQLRYIVAVDTHRHFATAAEHCFVTQPTLSMQISKMEKALEVLIFDRSKHPIEPTEIGARIIQQARLVLQESQRIDDLVRGGKNTISGDFRLGIIPTVSPNLLPRFIRGITQKYPDIHMKVEELTTDHIIAKLDRDQLDAGIMATPLDDNRLIELPLYQESFMAFVPEGHRLEAEEFILHSELKLGDILLLKSGHCFRQHVINLCSGAFPEKMNGDSFEFESGNFDTLIRLSMQGFGMTLIPYLTALDLPEEQKHFLKPIEHPQPNREISLVYNKAQLKLGMLELIAEEIKAHLPKKLLEPKLSPPLSPLPEK
jgi:LysR family hydrogen peroxide-inducible transcriptional activator